MAIPLISSPAPAPNLLDLINGDSRRFTSSLGSWTNSGGTLSRQTTGGWLNNAPRLQLITTAANQYARLPLSGTFLAGQRYDFVLVGKLDESPATVSWRVRFGLDGTDHVNIEATQIGSSAPGGGNYRMWIGSWIPTANRSGVTLTLYRVGGETGTQTWSIGYARAARVAGGGMGLWAFKHDADTFTNALRGRMALFNEYGGGIELNSNTMSAYGEAGAGSALYISEGYVSLSSEHTAGSRVGEGINLIAGADWVGLIIGEKSANELEIYPDWADHWITLQDGHQAGATRGWRAADEAGNPTGLLSKGPWRSLAAAPGSPGEGDCYYDTVTHKLRIFDGTVWQDLW